MLSVSVIGSGNVATALAKAFSLNGIKIDAVFSRNLAHAQALAKTVRTSAISRLEQLPVSSLYIIAVNDGAIKEISDKLKVTGVVAHTSGITNIDVLNKHHTRGIFYPLQTITQNKAINFDKVPLLLEANSQQTLATLKQYAQAISSRVGEADSGQRQVLHLAAVFANNFTNHLLRVAEDILQKNKLSFDLLQPLIEETLNNAQHQSPSLSQTGPARRKDFSTMEKHLEMLQPYPEYKQIYEMLSQSIRILNHSED